MSNLSAYRVIVICEVMSPNLQFFGSWFDAKQVKMYYLLSIDLFVIFRKITELITEFGSFSPCFGLDLTCECFEFVDVFWANIFFNCEQLKIESLLVGFL